MRRKPQKNKRGVQAPPTTGHAPPMQNALTGFKAEEIAAKCHVDLATARRWKAGTSRIPYTALLVITGDLEAIFGAEWRGWRIAGGTLYSPDQWTINRNDALSVPLLHAQIQALRQELATFKEAASIEEQPAPPEQWPKILA